MQLAQIDLGQVAGRGLRPDRDGHARDVTEPAQDEPLAVRCGLRGRSPRRRPGGPGRGRRGRRRSEGLGLPPAGSSVSGTKAVVAVMGSTESKPHRAGQAADGAAAGSRSARALNEHDAVEARGRPGELGCTVTVTGAAARKRRKL